MKKLFCLALLVCGVAVANVSAQCSKSVAATEKKCCASPKPGCKAETGTASAASLTGITANAANGEKPAAKAACCAGKKASACGMKNGTASTDAAPAVKLVAEKKESGTY